jgi:hypothetical protein
LKFTRGQKADDTQPTKSMSTEVMTVRIGQGGARARDHQFEIVTASEGRYEFRAESVADMDAWLRAIQCSILWSLEQLPGRSSAITSASGSVQGRDV